MDWLHGEASKSRQFPKNLQSQSIDRRNNGLAAWRSEQFAQVSSKCLEPVHRQSEQWTGCMEKRANRASFPKIFRASPQIGGTMDWLHGEASNSRKFPRNVQSQSIDSQINGLALVENDSKVQFSIFPLASSSHQTFIQETSAKSISLGIYRGRVFPLQT